MIIHCVIYLFSLVERANTQLQSSKPNAWFSFLVGRGSSNTKVFRSSSDIRQHLLPTRFHWGSALPSGQFLPAKAAFIGGDPVPSSSSHCGLGQTRIGLLPAANGGRRSSSSLIRSSALDRIEGQGQVYLLAIEGTIVHWRSL